MVDQLPQCVPPSFYDSITKPSTCPTLTDPWYRRPSKLWFYSFWIVVFLFYAIRLCMGNSASNIYKKTSNYIRGSSTSPNKSEQTSNSLVVVRERRSSLSRDDDDDIAHEFWEETKPKDGKTRMKRVLKTYPLGLVKLPVPCLHPDFTRVMLPNYDIMGKLQSQAAEKSTET
ncbi:hypothetical protein ACHWQZ_G009958 [Mnemiopsis leidyi]